MQEVKSLDNFKKVSNREEWEKWIHNYCSTHSCRIDGNFFMDRFSLYDFNRCEDKQASIKQLIAFEEYYEFYVLKEEYC